MSQSSTQLYLAHTVKTDADVGATFHLEPDHNPRSGEPATVWFALTKAGGETIALDRCDCQLTVYRAGDRSQAVATPPLEAISAEGYEDIPGADFVFPEAGVYELELTGAPTQAGDFQAFALAYDVTVRPGQAAQAPAAASSSSGESVAAAPESGTNPNTAPSGDGLSVGGYLAIAVTVVLVAGWAIARSRQGSSKPGSR